jgi:hypothetical protein
MKLCEALEQFKYALMAEYGEKSPIIRIVITRDLGLAVAKEFANLPYQANQPGSFGTYMLCGVEIEPRIR